MIFNEWLDILIYRKKPVDISKTGLAEGLKHVAIASAITSFLVGISTWISLPFMSELAGSEAGGYALFGATAGPLMLVMYTVLGPISTVISSLIIGGILHIFSLIFGGKGKYENYVGVLAKIDAALQGTIGVLLAIILIVVALLGADAYFASMPLIIAIGLIMGFWSLVLAVLATQAVQKLSLGKAILAVVIIPLIIGTVLLALLIALLSMLFPPAI
ncbi:MAG: YIP1 family protein [archaeon]